MLFIAKQHAVDDQNNQSDAQDKKGVAEYLHGQKLFRVEFFEHNRFFQLTGILEEFVLFRAVDLVFVQRHQPCENDRV